MSQSALDIIMKEHEKINRTLFDAISKFHEMTKNAKSDSAQKKAVYVKNTLQELLEEVRGYQ